VCRSGSSVERTGVDAYATVAVDASSGDRAWVRRYHGPGNCGDSATSVAVSPDGSKVFVTGSSAGRIAGANAAATVAYDASTGTTVWVRRYNGPENDGLGTSVAVSPDGSKVFVTGTSTGTAGEGDYATVAYAA